MEYQDIKTVLSIAGSDPSGGAGIQADIKTILANGCYAMTALTALTAQNTMGVSEISKISPSFLRSQLDAVFSDIIPDAIKVGMVLDRELIEVIADFLRTHKAVKTVIDPVMVSTSNSRLLEEEAVASLREKLFPLATLITPNIPEAEVLSGRKICGRKDMAYVGNLLSEEYKTAVLIKGGHLANGADDDPVNGGQPASGADDYLVDGKWGVWLYGEKIDNPNTHGTGCTLSSAIASNLAKGNSLYDSVRLAKDYLAGALLCKINLGRGSGPLNHGWRFNSGKKRAEKRPEKSGEKRNLREAVKLYAVTMDDDCDENVFLDRIKQAIDGGITCLQLRKKNCKREEYTKLAGKVKKLSDDAGIYFIVNDDADVALAAEADGVHLGQEDMNPEEARKLLGKDKIIGVTVHNVKEAVAAEKAGADYLGAGAVFATDTKKNTIPLSTEELRKICGAVRIPVVAIGGINEANVEMLQGCGIAGIAVVSAVFGAKHIREAAERLLRKTDQILSDGIKGVIFDMDGTLLDSMGMWATVGERYLKKRGLVPKEEINLILKPMTMRQASEYVKREYQLPSSVDEIISEVISMMRESYRDTIPLKKGVPALIRSLKEKNIKMIVATATEYELAKAALVRNGIWEELEGVITCTMVNAGKEDPKIYRMACEKLACAPSQCVVFEDSLFAVETAKKAGFTVIGVYDGEEKSNWEKIKEKADGWIFLEE